MASRLMLPTENPLNSHMYNLQQMELETIELISQCSLLHQAKQYQITNAKSQITTHFQNIINKLQIKQNEFLIELDNINNHIHSEQSTLSSITAIINNQKQSLLHYSRKQYSDSNADINKINQHFDESKKVYSSCVKSIQNSLSSMHHHHQISEIMNNVQQYITSTFQNTQSKQSIPQTQISNAPTMEQKKQDTTIKKSLLNDTVYCRLQSCIKPRNNFYYQYVSKPLIPYVLSINILTEFLPNKIIKTLFNYLPKLKQFSVANYVKNGWEVSDNILHDYPNIFVENILPIQNQPTLIITIGLPGSGKTTWAKIRNCKAHTIFAADDYFDKFNNGDFNPGLLAKAHEWTQLNVEHALRAGYNVVANNTNTTFSEMHAYVTKVIFGNLPHKIVFAVMPETNINLLMQRGVHGVPHKQCVNMLKRFNNWYKKGPPSVGAVLKAGGFKKDRFGNKKNISKDVIYTGVFMNKATQDQIRRHFMNVCGKPLLCNTTDCHLTLKFQPFYGDVNMLPFGKTVKLKLVGYSMHKYVQTFLVDIMDQSVRNLCVNKHPHITVSFDENFVRPNYANTLLENGKVIPIINNFDIVNSVKYNELYRMRGANGDNGGLIVEGTIGAFFRGGKKGSGVKFIKPEKVQRQGGSFYKPQPNNASRFRR